MTRRSTAKLDLRAMTVASTAALLCGGIAFGLLDSRLFGESDDFTTGIWFQTCVTLAPCPLPGLCPPGTPAGTTCYMCATTLPRSECQWTFANQQCTETAGTGLCGTKTRGICAGGAVGACNAIGFWGACDAPVCASGPILREDDNDLVE